MLFIPIFVVFKTFPKTGKIGSLENPIVKGLVESPLSVSGLGSHHLAAAVPLPYTTFNYLIWGPCIPYIYK
jgi:hypothetical protein